ncbi:hypothetical protein [Nostoc sp. 'Peltigera malacea cyanobiont' DB3992]|uniref:hypothetical protein n=1 Tax=Nostoc sp. 'Peltigera malacea cyanobiont' DB3992 TaxID=1206980 RepID=UPI000C041B73|nr:hypothetical protein [Nostoc sp. 'Peltigera malacea cyanobiont' DB3992]PHM11655.1 hypothetical protein CK516_01565 [Nostoc sp. 'Peltigera malacea cyanobiont' DB3992]
MSKIDIDGDSIPDDSRSNNIYDGWNILPINEKSLEEIISEMGNINPTEELELSLCLIRRIAFNLCETPSAKEARGLSFHILCEQYISRLTINQRIEKIQELANKIQLQRFDKKTEEQIKPLTPEELDAYENSVSCRECWGTGQIYDSINGTPTKCRDCNGTGYW